ncbi:MAG: HD domain-containing protein, partial [Phycisphaerae bacterium]
MTQKLFRDPVYDYITIDTKKYPWLLDLLNTAEVQRLRFISQLGLSQFTYPGSNHSRFSHSLGVLHLMKEYVSYLKLEHSEKFAQLDEEALLAASLLHDIGHSPFSHATERFFGNHEERAAKIILNRSSNIHKILRRVSDKLPKKVADLISEIPLLGTKLWQKSLISSQLDMDRLDYLRRDSLCSGAEYGNFDCFRIIHTMGLTEGNIGGGKKDTWITWPKKS